MSTISPLFTSKCQHGQYRTLKLSGVFITYAGIYQNHCIIQLQIQKNSKPCTQLLRYKQPVPYLPVNASMDNTVL